MVQRGDTVRPAVDWRAVGVFLGLTFAVSWLVAGLFWILGGRWGSLVSTPVGVLYMFVPMTAALLVQKRLLRRPAKEPLGISFKLNRWWFVAWLAPAGISLAVLGVSLFLPGVRFSWDMAGLFERFQQTMSPERIEQMKAGMKMLPVHPFWLALGQGLVAGATVNAVAGFGEELGWRGFLQEKLGALGFWKSSLAIGVVWGVWHAPLILQGHNYPVHRIAGVFMMVAWCTLLGPLFSFVRLRAKSVVAAGIMHGTLNATAGLAIMVVKGGNDLLVGVTGAAGFVVLSVLVFVLAVYGGPVGRRRPGGPV